MNQTEENQEKFQAVVLAANDTSKFTVERRVIEMSLLVKDMLEEYDEDEDDSPLIPVPNVDGSTLKLTIQYCQHHWNNQAKKLPKPLRTPLHHLITKWDQTFLPTSNKVLVDLAKASNYMNIPDLVALTTAKMATLIKGKKAGQIREMFGIKNDLSEEEESKLKEENKWCQEV